MGARDVFLIINPMAGRGRGPAIARHVATVLNEGGMKVVETFVHAPGEARTLAEQAARDGFAVVGFAGGDGTLHEVVNGLLARGIQKQPALAVIPLGTANIFARALRLPSAPAAVARLILKRVTQMIDVGQVNDRYFATVAGIGFDAAVVRTAARWPRRINGKVRHAAAALLRLIRFDGARSLLRIDGRELHEKLFLLAAANTAWYGAGIHIAPDARTDDGRLTVVTIRSVGALKSIRLLFKTFSGTHLSDPNVRHTDATELYVETDPPLPVHADGEDVGDTPVRVRCQPAALEVLVPPVRTLSA